MSSTIKVDKNLKTELDKLQAKITLKTGRKISQQELLNKIFNFTSQNEDEFFQNQILEWNSPKREEWEVIKGLISDFRYVTKEELIDKELYGH